MIHDNLIDTILERAEDYFYEGEVLKASKSYERAFRRIFITIEEEKMNSINEYTNKYEIDYLICNIVDDYLVSLDDCFSETGDKSYLEKIIQFKEKYGYLFVVEKDVYMTILRSEIEAIFYLGKKDESLSMYEKLIEKEQTDDISYYNFSRLCYEAGKIEKAIEVLKLGIKKCEFGIDDMKDRLEMYEDELKYKKKKQN